MSAKATRWGIVGAGLISNDFCLAIRTFSADEHEIVAVAARKQEDADGFAKKHAIKNAYADYAAIAADASVDVVYIGVLHPRHAELSILMLNAGKAVVCEKPMAMSATEARCVIDAARTNKKLFLEGFWSRFFPAYRQLHAELAQGSIGEVRALSVHFGVKFEESPTSRIVNKEMGGGVALDIGCYAVQLANLVFNMEKPEKIFVHGCLFSTGVDKKFSATLMYKNDRMAQFFIAGDVDLSNRAIVSGTKGFLELPPNFWCPTQLVTPTQTLKFELPSTSEPTRYRNSCGFAYEVAAVRDALLNGLTEMPQMTHNDSLLVSEILDEILHQLGVKY